MQIEDDDTLVKTIGLELDANSFGEGDDNPTTVTVTARLQGTGTSTDDTEVALSFDPGGTTATKGTDFTVSPDPLGSVTIPKGQLSATKTIEFTPRQDQATEGDEIIVIRGEVSGFTVTNAEDITLADDDSPTRSVSLSVSPASLAEGDNSTTVTVTANIDGGTRPHPIKVKLSLSGTATRGTGKDYTAASDFGDTGDDAVDITIAARSTSGSVMLAIDPNDDTVDDDGEVITVGGTATRAARAK